jgi:calcineurin-like phosphoesterase family protein
MLNDTAKGIQCLRRLNGKIYILTGNHDTFSRIQQYVNISPNILHLGYVNMITYRKCNFYLSHYPTLTSNLDAGKPLNRRVINLCGHTHTQDRFADWDSGLIYHCEMDAHNCTPVSMEEIYNDIVKKLEKEHK